MDLPSFTPTGNLRDILATPASGEIPTPTWTGAYCIFASNIKDGVLVWDGKVFSRPPSVKATVDATTGDIEIADGALKLLANDPGLNVTGIQWRCDIKTSSSNTIASFWFDAPEDGDTVDLATVAHAPSASVNPVGGITEQALLALLEDAGSDVYEAVSAIGGGGGGDDDYHEYANLAAFPVTGSTDLLYLAQDTGYLYRWNGSAYIRLADKASVGLGNVDNTSDANKPVSTAQQTALNLKAPLASPAFTGTPTGITKAHVGLGSVDNTADTAKPVSTAQQTALDLKAPLASPTFTGTVAGVTKTHVGLGNVDNTSDASKPISTATQAALDLKQLKTPTQRYGSGAPSNSLGVDGDTYTDYTGEKKYTKAAGVYAVTTDTTVSKEVALTGGTWATTAGTLTTDTTDGMTIRKIVTALNTNSIVSYALAAGVNMTNKMVRVPIRLDSLDGWSGIITFQIASDSSYNNRVEGTVVSKDVYRADEVEAFSFCPNLGFASGTPDFTSMRYFRWVWRDNNTTVRTAYMGQPVLIG